MTRILVCLVCLAPGAARGDLYVKNFSPTVNGDLVAYSVDACHSAASQQTSVGFYYNLSAGPGPGISPSITRPATATMLCQRVTSSRVNTPIGLYRSYVKVDPGNLITEPNELNNIFGPREVCVGPDVVIKAFSVDKSGAAVTYKATVCNDGSMTAYKFRVGFWHNTSAAPTSTDMGNIFKSIKELASGKCAEVTVSGGLRPNGSFSAWSRADSGDFVKECRETNNPRGPLNYSLSNPDLAITYFQARVSGAAVTYSVRVCNKGTAAVSKFYVDIYYHRPRKAPSIGDPGDRVQSVQNLGPSACTSLTFQRSGAANGQYSSYALADADDFISEPNEANNMTNTLIVTVGSGSAGSGICTDSDKDGHGTGSGCTGVPDCNDNDAKISPKATEICGNKVDEDCDLTPDDGCPGVKCNDSDGDGFGVGADCVLPDCDDSNKQVYPWAPEICGDNLDDNCNKIADDGCPGRQCVDQDADGFGVGKGCPGPQDCQDTNHWVRPGAKERCGDGIDDDCDGVPDDGCSTAVDNDGDGATVGGGTVGQPDCDDDDPTISPDMPERCGDGVDNDCDGTVDDGCPGVKCTDGDGDGWGVGADCKIPDCNDKDASVYPWATEVCKDNKDNDCDGTVDDGCPGVNCKDKDLDGFGVGAGCCDVPSTRATCKQDCNDNDGGAHPWAREICSDDVDNDCDGKKDEGCVVCEDQDQDTFGVGPKCASWDCDDTDKSSFPGAPEICNNKDNNCNGKKDDQCSGGETGCSCSQGPVRGAPDAPLALVWLLLGAVLLGAALRRRPPRVSPRGGWR